MITMRLRGGLGNQMFQYALGLVLAKLNDTGLRLDLSAYSNTVNRKYDLGCFDVAASLVRLPMGIPEKEKDFTFDPSILGRRGELFLDGYWQSEKYFSDHGSLVREAYAFKEPPKDAALWKEIINNPSVCVHLRRGDYASHPHTTQWHGLMPLEYYKNGYGLVKEREPDAKFFIFTDEPDWEGLKDYEGTVVKGDGHEHLQLMSGCKHFIIANSSFSWWGAWLSQREGIVVAPRKWFNEAPYDTRDLIPERWIQLDQKEQQMKPIVKPMVAIHSCVKFANTGVHEAIRKTFGKRCPWPLFFFIGKPGEFSLEGMTKSFMDDCKKWKFVGGNGEKLKARVFSSPEVLERPLLPDEIEVDCNDSYIAIPWKKKETTKFQLERGFTHCFQLVGDSYVKDWDGLATCGFDRHDYSGVGSDGVYCYGALGYWLSADAARRLLDSPVNWWSEDYWVGRTMQSHGICPHRLSGDWVDELSKVGHGGGLSAEAILKHEKATVEGPAAETLIAIVTCKDPKYAAKLEVQKKTWIPQAIQAGYAVKTFTGDDLGVPDDYLSLPLKTKTLCKWALKNGYRHVLKVDDDCCLNVKNLKVVTNDYAGIRVGPHDAGQQGKGIPDFPKGTIKFEYASGGAYWVSERSIRILADAPFDKEWAEDRWVGQTLGKAGIQLTVLPNYLAPPWTNRYGELPYTSFLNDNIVAVTQIPKAEEILVCHEILSGKRPRPVHIPPPSPLPPPVSIPTPRQFNKTAAPWPIPPPRPMDQAMTPVATPMALTGAGLDWRGTLLGAKVARAVARGFKVAAICPLGSSYHKQLSKAIPRHIEEIVDTQDGKRVLFLVK